MFDWLRGMFGPAPEPRRRSNPPTGPQHFASTAPGFSPPPLVGPQLDEYPSSAEAAVARQGGFGYGEPYSAYVEGLAGRVFGDKKGPIPMEGVKPLPDTATITDLMKRIDTAPTTQALAPKDRNQLQDVVTRAALATNYSPVAALGFDPSAATFDVTGKTKYGYSGLTDPQTGKMVVQAPPGPLGADDASTLVHESMHKGLLGLLNDPSIPAHLRRRLEPSSVHHESLVRQLMHLQAGNPEGDTVAKEQRLEGAQWSPEDIEILNRAAQGLIKERRPRGPR